MLPFVPARQDSGPMSWSATRNALEDEDARQYLRGLAGSINAFNNELDLKHNDSVWRGTMQPDGSVNDVTEEDLYELYTMAEGR